MDVLEVFEDEIKEYKRLKTISEMVLVREHIKLFEQKYRCSFQDFEKRVQQEAENFTQWDDYIEWKAYQKSFEGLKKKIGEIEHAKDIRIIE
jgi:accessory colonization factor AcfC